MFVYTNSMGLFTQVKIKDIQYLNYLKEQNKNIKQKNHLRIVDNNKKVLDNENES